MADGLAIGIDVGGTKAAAALVDCEAGGTVLARAAAATPAGDPEGTVATLIELARDLAARPEAGGVRAIGLGAAGMIDLEGEVRFAPNISWRDIPLARRMTGALGLPT